MKKVLVIAPSSYPVLGPECIVNIKLLKTLTQNGGFEIDLISKKNKWSFYPSKELSNYNVRLRSLNVIEVDNVINIRTIWGHIKSLFKFGVVFKGAHWASSALPIALKLCSNNKYDYILTKNESSFLIGHYLKKKYGIKWVATWNDPYPGDSYPPPYGNGYININKYPERKMVNIMQNADKHIFPNNRLRDYMLSYLNVSIEKTCIVPHVMHNIDVDTTPLKSNVLKLIHSGNISAPRNPINFLIALKNFIKSKSANVEFTILGVADPNIESLINSMDLCRYVKFIPPVSYDESLEHLKGYHVALIIEADCQEGIYLPTKVVDFMQQKKHIFSISPINGVLKDLYTRGKIRYFSDVTSPESIYDTLCLIYDEFTYGLLNLPSLEYEESFKEDNILKIYDNLF